MSDLICRQAAIDALEWKWAGKSAVDAIKELPTAQPEIIRCADCKHYDTHDHRCKYWNHGVVVMDYCSHAERKADE